MSLFTNARNITIEVEALLALADSLGEHEPKTAEILALAKEKVSELSVMLATTDKPEELPTETHASAELYAPESVESESEPHEPHPQSVADETEEEVNVATGDVEAAVADNEADELIENAASEEIENNLVCGEDTLEIPRVEDKAELKEEDTYDQPQPAEEPQDVATKPIPPSEIASDTVTEVSASDKPLGYDRMELATDVNERTFMANARDLTKVFTLNDKFRFRRELFGNSNAEFTRALDLISVMRQPEEADDYFFTDLGWDAENEDVKDFMRIIRSYLLTKQSSN